MSAANNGIKLTEKNRIMKTETFYKVMKVFRVSNRREILRRNLTLEEARRVVSSYADSSRSMVVFQSQANYSNAAKT